jgi:hypothetical protein
MFEIPDAANKFKLASMPKFHQNVQVQYFQTGEMNNDVQNHHRTWTGGPARSMLTDRR